MIFDAAVIIPTILRPSLTRAVRSVFAQDFTGRVQVIVGVDVAKGSREVIETLGRECPPRMELTVIDIGYSTSTRHGGFYPIYAGGALRTIMSFAANSRYLAYLDDDNWWAPSHLSDLLRSIAGFDWAYSFRWYVDPRTQQPLCVDEWESVGPGKGVYKERFNGFVDTNCIMLDKEKCNWILPAWCIPFTDKGEGEDRIVYQKLHTEHPSACTGNATVYYVFRPGDRQTINKLIAGD